MTRKDYEKIAKAVKSVDAISGLSGPQTMLKIVAALGDVFSADNPNFNREKFEQVCDSDVK